MMVDMMSRYPRVLLILNRNGKITPYRDRGRMPVAKNSLHLLEHLLEHCGCLLELALTSKRRGRDSRHVETLLV
jgi:hypothetical protein